MDEKIEAFREEALQWRDRAAEHPVPRRDARTCASDGSLAKDNECKHCKEAQPLMQSLLAKYGNDVKLYFKHFPITSNNALNAAIGAAAARNQGKFWQFSDKVWEHSDHVTPAVVEAIANELGLDFPRWYADVGSEDVRAHVQRDKAEARALEIRRTPAIFIDGRRYTDALDVVSLTDWLDEALGR